MIEKDFDFEEFEVSFEQSELVDIYIMFKKILRPFW
jgi:hypothetical protein